MLADRTKLASKDSNGRDKNFNRDNNKNQLLGRGGGLFGFCADRGRYNDLFAYTIIRVKKQTFFIVWAGGIDGDSIHRFVLPRLNGGCVNQYAIAIGICGGVDNSPLQLLYQLAFIRTLFVFVSE